MKLEIWTEIKDIPKCELISTTQAKLNSVVSANFISTKSENNNKKKSCNIDLFK